MKHMKRLLLLAAMPVLCSLRASAQYVEYFKTYGNSAQSSAARCVTKTSDGNIVFVAGDAVGGNTDMLLVKTNFIGDTLWTKRYGIANAYDYPYNITQLAGGDLLIAGFSVNTAPGSPTVATLLRTDAQGAVLWQKNYPRAGYSTSFNDLKVLNDGYAICGILSNAANGNGDAWLVKTNFNGDTLWTNSYGGANYDDAWQIEKTPDGGFLLGGGSYTYRTGTQQDDAWLVKISGTGAQQWIKHYGNADTVDWIWSLTPAVRNGVTTGYAFVGVKNFDQANLTCDLFFAKVDTVGNLLWDKSMTGLFGFIQGFAIEQMNDGGFYIAATELDPTVGIPLLMIRTDSLGNVTDQLHHGTQVAITPRSLYLNNLGDAFVVGSRGTQSGSLMSCMLRIRNIYSGFPSSVQTILPANDPISVYPNPATDGCVVTSRTEPIQRIELRDAAGRTLFNQAYPGSFSEKINLNGLTRGMVFVRVYTRGIAPTVINLVLQ